MKWIKRDRAVRSFARDTAGIASLSSSYRGIRSIPVDQIVGSVGRAHELRPNFMSVLLPFGDDRFRAIRSLMEEGRSLPPIEVHQLGDRYYVVDGHHRVAAARKVGQLALDAVVTEYRPVGAAAA